MDKIIISVTGKDTVGIIAGICTALAQKSINILDISQTIVQDIFSMVMIVDIASSPLDFAAVNETLQKEGEKLGVTILCQREDIFDKMHRI